ncbi:MAG: hydrogenase subunit MbhD domain-containing protein [Pseudomonadota bacterium]|nr:hydrogenase subunit MbhD domain-containing protein [Pseudomonadota bacterium]
MITWIALIVVIVLLVSAVAVLVLKNFIGAVAAASVVSLGVSVLFVLLRAPDVAMTEAAVGAGLSGVVLALGLRRLGLWRLEGDRGEAHPLVATGHREDQDA